jgi:ATP-dependent DNA helicase RecQ
MMKRYVIEKSICRSQQLLSYFSETDSERCGICDVCLKRNQLDLTDFEFDEIKTQINNLLSKTPLAINEVVAKTEKNKEAKTLLAIRWLLDNRALKINANNQLTLPQ